MSSLKWIGAIRKLLPKALLKRLRMGVTYKDEAIGDIAERIETIFKALTMEEKEKKKSLLGKYIVAIAEITRRVASKIAFKVSPSHPH